MMTMNNGPRIHYDYNLIYHAKMLEGSGLVAFDRISKTNGNLNNMEGDEWLKLGNIGGADFDGIDERVATGRTFLLDNETRYSALCYFRLTTLPTSDKTLFGIRTNGAMEIFYFKYEFSTGCMQFIRRNQDESTLTITGSTTILANTLYSIAGVTNESEGKLYINGALDGNLVADYDSNPADQQLTFGSRKTASFWPGEGYDPRVYIGEVPKSVIDVFAARRDAAVAA